MRRIKDAVEIEILRRAAEVARASFAELDGFVRPGVGEWEVEALLESGFRVRGARGPAFPTIVGGGDNGCVLHYTENADRVGEGQLVVVDGGAEVDWYASDMTRTYLSSPSPAPEREAIVALVDAARVAAIGAIAPGVAIDEIHRIASTTLLEGLVGLGVLRGAVGDLLDRRQEQAFFPHQTSHWLGLDVHDPGDYARGGESVALQPGMVLTVEPGLYFPRGGASRRASAGVSEPDTRPFPPDPPPVFDAVVDGVAVRFEGIGVRIEDTVLVTPEGSAVLTR